MRRGVCLLSAVAFLLCFRSASAQQSSAALEKTAADAAIIFRGRVLAVEMEPGRAPDEMNSARVTLRVEEAVRGVARGESITIRQWNVASDEYRVGESLVLLLHAPSPELGLTSPVGGRAGHLRVDQVPDVVLDSWRGDPPGIQPAAPTRPPAPPVRPPRRTRNVRVGMAEAEL